MISSLRRDSLKAFERAARPNRGASAAFPDDRRESTLDTVTLAPSLSAVERTGWRAPLLLVQEIDGGQADLVSLAKSLAQTQLPAGGWADKVGQQVADIDSSVINHLALATFLRRVAHAEKFPRAYQSSDLQRLRLDAGTVRVLESALVRSWEHLNGEVPPDQAGLLGALPARKVLDGVSQPAALLAEALLGNSLQVRLEPETLLNDALRACEGALRGDALEAQPARGISWGKVLATGAAVGAAALLAPHVGVVLGLGQLIGGVALGWMVTSFNEAVVHEKMLHVNDLPINGARPASTTKPRSWVSKLYSASPEWVKKPIKEAWFGHTKIHHFRTFSQDQVTQFKTPEEKEKLDAYLAKEGRDDLQDAEYGLTLSGSGYLTFQALSSPTYALAIGAATMLGAGPLFAAGFLLAAVGGEYVSKEYHRYTHKPAKTALAEASLPMKMFLKTDLSRFNVRSHFAHHQDPSVNFNLLPGADWVRGTYQKATVAQEEELRRLKVLW